MTSFSSNIVKINKSQKDIFLFLSDFTNFEHLFPEEITDRKFTNNECSFTIKGMANISLVIAQKIPFSKILINTGKDNKFNFEMIMDFAEIDENNTNVCFTINADLNPMMKMMLQKPLTNLLNMLVDKLNYINI
jgi:hypothetical protein